jgi:hypothetical protein
MGQKVVPNHCITPIFDVPALKPQIIIHRDSYLLIGAQIPLGGLDRRVPEQEFDLFEVAAALPTEFGASTAQVVGAEVLDPDLLRCLFNYRPDRPVAQRVAIDLPPFGNRAQQPAVFDAGRGRPGVDAVLDPDGMATVRMRRPLPSRSARTHLPSRCWTVSTSSL